MDALNTYIHTWHKLHTHIHTCTHHITLQYNKLHYNTLHYITFKTYMRTYAA